MMISALLLSLMSASGALAQTRATRVVLPGTSGVPFPLAAAPAPGFLAPVPFALSAPLSLTAAMLPAPAIAPLAVLQPAAAARVDVTPLSPAAKVAALSADVANVVASLGDKSGSDSSSLAAGRDLEALITGEALSAPSDGDFAPASAEEVAFAAGASAALAARADDLGPAKGLKPSGMTGADFVSLLEEARASAPAAPTPAAAAAAREIEAQAIRVARALLPADKPFLDGARRALAVWQVFDQELGIAATKGSLAAVVAEAQLFASQVEASVEPAKPEPAMEAGSLAPSEHPEDPNDYAAVSVPGSIFGWRPIEESPGHGLPPVDALIRRVLGERNGAYAKGFELPGAAARENARVYLYGERHSDGELITANMKRLVEDARAGKPVIVLVEGYTGWTLRGFQAFKYLAERGLDADALAAKLAGAPVEVRGWDDLDSYEASRSRSLQHHMNLLALNHLAHGETRGWKYYREFARAAITAARSYKALWRAAIVARNGDLDRAVAKAAADADASGATVHVVAGTDHLTQNPRLAGRPVIGAVSLRATLRAALGGRPFWASQPPNSKR